MKKKTVNKIQLSKAACSDDGDVPQSLGHRGWGAQVCRSQAQTRLYFSLVWDYLSFNTIRFLGLRLFPKLLCISV